ncbi:MAG: dihydropteroate synthase [Candidatus Gracilibacteria bacterium]|nr:dihydropteroate synthase [Candidatus Gracilibacteria bacterium]
MSAVKFFGILNVTPDSFSDGGAFFAPETAIVQAKKLFAEGADFLDIGGQSTRPGAAEISPEEEWGRVEPVFTELLSRFPQKISLDTRHPSVAHKFLALGGSVLNAVSGVHSPEMQEVIAAFQPTVIVMHFPGETIAQVHAQAIDSAEIIRDDLLTQKDLLKKCGLPSEKIILDPGIGFGKTMQLNADLLTFPALLPEEQVLIGHSRKRFLGPDRFTLTPNLLAAKRAVESGAAFLRVHEVAPYKALQKEPGI